MDDNELLVFEEWLNKAIEYEIKCVIVNINLSHSEMVRLHEKYSNKIKISFGIG